MESTANQWEWAGHTYIIYIYIMVVLKSEGCAAPNFTPCRVKAFEPLHRQADEMYYEDEGEAGQNRSEEITFVWQDNMCWIRKNPYCFNHFIGDLSTNMLKGDLMLRGNVFLMWRFKFIYQHQPIPPKESPTKISLIRCLVGMRDTPPGMRTPRHHRGL